jgi:hypothetical protein
MGLLIYYGVLYGFGFNAKESAQKLSWNTGIPIGISVAIQILIPVVICVIFIISSIYFWNAMERIKKVDRAYYDYMCRNCRKVAILIASSMLVGAIIKAAFEML